MTDTLLLFVSGSITEDSITLTHQQAIDLELALNKSHYGHSWKQIGDVLFNFGFDTNIAIDSYEVTEVQMNFLKELAKKEKIFD